MKNQSTEEYQEQTESVMPSERQVYDRIERHFKRQKRQLVMRAVGRTLYISGLGKSLSVVLDEKTAEEPKPSAERYLTSATFSFEGVAGSPELVRMMKEMVSRCFFSRKDIKRMRHFVTHGSNIWIRCPLDGVGFAYEIARTPRELRLLLEKIHYVRSDWFANLKSNIL